MKTQFICIPITCGGRLKGVCVCVWMCCAHFLYRIHHFACGLNKVQRGTRTTKKETEESRECVGRLGSSLHQRCEDGGLVSSVLPPRGGSYQRVMHPLSCEEDEENIIIIIAPSRDSLGLMRSAYQ